VVALGRSGGTVAGVKAGGRVIRFKLVPAAFVIAFIGAIALPGIAVAGGGAARGTTGRRLGLPAPYRADPWR